MPINFIAFFGSVSNTKPEESQGYIDSLVASGSTVTVVFVNPGYHMSGIETFSNVNIVYWSDDSTELFSNIRRNMKCGIRELGLS